MTSDGRRDSEEIAAWQSFLLMSQMMQQIVDRQLRHDSGMPHAYYTALVTLAQEGAAGGVLLTDLADASNYSQSRMSQAVKKMEESDWIVRSPDPLDKRAVRLALSERGRLALARASVRHLALVREAFTDALSREQLLQLAAIGNAVLPGLVQRAVAPGALKTLRRYVGLPDDGEDHPG